MALDKIEFRMFALAVTLAVMLLFLNGCCAQNDAVSLRSYSSSDGYYTVSLPESWKVDGFKCSGITAQDISNSARGLSYLSKLHEGFVVLPAGVTPESYLENYMPQDFSLGGNDVHDMRIIDYEEPSFYNNKDVLSLLSGASLTSIPTSTKAMRCSFTVNGIPAEGSFVIRTKNLYGYGTKIDYLLGIYSPAHQFDIDTPMLLEAFNSVKFNPAYRNICMPVGGGDDCHICLDNQCCSHVCNANGKCS
jgi:hypothetical protein